MRRSNLLFPVLALGAIASTALAQGTPAPATAKGAPAEAPSPNLFIVRDLGLQFSKPPSWSFTDANAAQASRMGFLLDASGLDATRDALRRSFTLCTINKFAAGSAPRQEPNPGASVTVQSFQGVDSIPDAQTFAKEGASSLDLVYKDIEFIDYLVPVTMGDIAGYRNRFRAKITDKVYKGTLIVEQLFAMQGRIGICFTYSDSEAGWKKTSAEFQSIQRSVELPKVAPPPPPPEP